MKCNLNHHFLDSQTYLCHLLESKRFNAHDYGKTISDIELMLSPIQKALREMAELSNINFDPYLFTLHVVDETERMAFYKFLKTYMIKTELLVPEEDLHHTIAVRPECFASFVFAMQYFFL